MRLAIILAQATAGMAIQFAAPAKGLGEPCEGLDESGPPECAFGLKCRDAGKFKAEFIIPEPTKTCERAALGQVCEGLYFPHEYTFCEEGLECSLPPNVSLWDARNLICQQPDLRPGKGEQCEWDEMN